MKLTLLSLLRYGLFLLLLCPLAAFPQKVTQLGTLSAAAVNDRIAKGLKGYEFPQAERPVDLKKITYTTTDAKGNRQSVSGLLVLPRGGAPKGLVVYMHGTTWDYKNAPSRMLTHKDPTYPEPLVFAASGYAVASPDYIGLGDSTAFHPYPLNVVNGRSGKDIIKPLRNYARNAGYDIADKLFVTGYSEGGGTAMGTVKLLEESGDPAFRVTRAAPASGPYDLTGVTRDYLLEDATGEGIIARAYLLGYSISYFKHDFGIKTSDYFSKTMATTVNLNFKRGKSDKSIGLALIVMGAISGGTKSRDHLMTPRFIKALEDTDLSDPVLREMSKNNVYDWAPRTEMMIVSLATDKIVDPRNATTAMRYMRRRGVTDRTLRHLEINDPSLDHGTVIPQATYNILRFFDGGFDSVPQAR